MRLPSFLWTWSSNVGISIFGFMLLSSDIFGSEKQDFLVIF